MPDQSSRPADELENQLDALGRALAAQQPAEPPAALLAAVRARHARRIVVARVGGALALAALLAIAIFAYTTSRPRPSHAIIATGQPSPTPPSPTSLPTSPTMAALRELNRDATPETLRFPSEFSTSASTPITVIQPIDAHDARAIAQLLGSGK